MGAASILVSFFKCIYVIEKILAVLIAPQAGWAIHHNWNLFPVPVELVKGFLYL